MIDINNAYALNVFKNGLNNDFKPTVFTSRPKDLNEAVQLALELEKDFTNNDNQILYFGKKKRRKNLWNANDSNNSNWNRNSNRNNNTYQDTY